MNKKGFTLVELLAVLIILSLLATISIAAISNSLNQYRERLYETQKENIKAAARVWATDHREYLPVNNPSESSVVCTYPTTCPKKYSVLAISLSQLQNNGYIDKKIKNVKNKEDLEQATVKISKVQGSKQYNYQLIFTNEIAYSPGDLIKVKVNSTSTRDFVVLETSSSIDTTVRAISKSNYTNSSWCSKSGCTEFDVENLPANWDYVKKVDLLTSSDIQTINSLYGNSPDYWTVYGGPGTFWLKTAYTSGNAFKCTVSVSCVNSSCTPGATISSSNVSQSAGIRPVIVTNKSRIVD